MRKHPGSGGGRGGRGGNMGGGGGGPRFHMNPHASPLHHNYTQRRGEY